MAPEILRQKGWSFGRGAKIIEKCNIRPPFCQISSGKNPKSPPTESVAPSSPPLLPPLGGEETAGSETFTFDLNSLFPYIF